MNKLAIIGLAALFASCSAAISKTKIYTVSFDGLCDTITITPDKALVLYATLHQTGCTAGERHAPQSNPIPGIGIVVKKNPGTSGSGRDLAVTDTVPDDLGTPVAFIYKLEYPLATGGYWVVYSTSDGKAINTGATGTYTLSVK